MINSIMAREIGLNTPLKKMFEKLLQGHNPIILTNKALYVLSADYYKDGKFAYTKFEDDIAVYSVLCYFSFKDSVGSILKKAELGLYGFIDPLIDEVPEVVEPTPSQPSCGCST